MNENFLSSSDIFSLVGGISNILANWGDANTAYLGIIEYLKMLRFIYDEQFINTMDLKNKLNILYNSGNHVHQNIFYGQNRYSDNYSIGRNVVTGFNESLIDKIDFVINEASSSSSSWRPRTWPRPPGTPQSRDTNPKPDPAASTSGTDKDKGLTKYLILKDINLTKKGNVTFFYTKLEEDSKVNLLTQKIINELILFGYCSIFIYNTSNKTNIGINSTYIEGSLESFNAHDFGKEIVNRDKKEKTDNYDYLDSQGFIRRAKNVYDKTIKLFTNELNSFYRIDLYAYEIKDSNPMSWHSYNDVKLEFSKHEIKNYMSGRTLDRDKIRFQYDNSFCTIVKERNDKCNKVLNEYNIYLSYSISKYWQNKEVELHKDVLNKDLHWKNINKTLDKNDENFNNLMSQFNFDDVKLSEFYKNFDIDRIKASSKIHSIWESPPLEKEFKLYVINNILLKIKKTIKDISSYISSKSHGIAALKRVFSKGTT